MRDEESVHRRSHRSEHSASATTRIAGDTFAADAYNEPPA